MYIGFMANFDQPTELARLTAIISKYYGLDIIYLRPKDVDMKNNTVHGKVYVNNKWKKKEVPLPPFIDIAPYCFLKKNREITDYLKENTILSDNRFNVLSKQQLQEKLLANDKFSHLVIPTHVVESFQDMMEHLTNYNKVVLKPIKGIRGKGVYILEKDKDNFNLGHYTEKRHLDYEGLKNFYDADIKNKGYILQKNITSRTLQGDPFDCRVHVEKDGNGKWVSALNYIRIGIGQEVISNVNQGGGISDPKNFLKANFGEGWEEINQKLNDLAVTLPYEVEKLRGTHIMSLGLDVGIESDGSLYLFEVNDGPATERVKSEVSFLRSNYYKYFVDNKLKLPLEQSAKVVKRNDYGSILDERDDYKKKYNKLVKELKSIKNSNSWRVTKPLRKIGKLRKK